MMQVKTKKMVITRKIEVFISEDDKELRTQLQKTLYAWRDAVRQAANLAVTHKFVQQNIRDFAYVQEDILQRFVEDYPERVVTSEKTGKEYVNFNVSDILKKEKGNSEQNTTYRIIATRLKGFVPSAIYSSLNQSVSKTVKESMPEVSRGNATLRCYKNDIPIPFPSSAMTSFRKENVEYVSPDTGEVRNADRYYFTLFGIPFQCRLGRDRSNNAVIIDRIVSGEYKACMSSLMFAKVVDRQTGKKKNKLYLLLCVEKPIEAVELKKGKVMFCYLGITHPIAYNYEVQAKNIYDSGVKWKTIGDAKEFLHGRLQIQEAVKRCQLHCRYSHGGKGRKRKLQALDRWHEKEKNYVHTKLHIYSRMLVDAALRNRCEKILLVNQTPREEQAKEDAAKQEPFVLRNWSYFGLKTMIAYKAKMAGIAVSELGKDAGTDDEEEALSGLRPNEQ